MSVSFDIIKRCFTIALLRYSWKFIKICDSNFSFSRTKTQSLSIAWFSRVSFLIRNHTYSYKRVNHKSFFNNKVRFKKSCILKLKIIEFSFCFLILSFFKVFSYSILDKYVWLYPITFYLLLKGLLLF